MSINDSYDVIVVGGGAAGMMAAGRAAARGLRVLLLEKNTVLGKKLSITGGGRCNITNAELEVRTFLQNYGAANRFLYSPFAQFGVRDTFQFFEEHGLPLVVEAQKRAFPQTQKATDVTVLLEQYCRKNGVEIHTNAHVRGFSVSKAKITGVVTHERTYTARAYILACGGMSHKETGSTGEGLTWLSTLGHTVHASNPNLVPLTVRETWIKRMSGVVLKGAQITFVQGTQKLAATGNILCTHFGLSGPTVLNCASVVKEMLKHGDVHATIDLFPKDDVGALRTKLHEHFTVHTNKSLYNALREWFPKGLTDAILMHFSEDVRLQKVHSVERSMRYKLTDILKNLPCTVTGTLGYAHAVISDGGADLREIDTKTMRSKLHNNLYIIGDMLDINRPSGGFSLQLCWTTGFVAGNSVCEGVFNC